MIINSTIQNIRKRYVRKFTGTRDTAGLLFVSGMTVCFLFYEIMWGRRMFIKLSIGDIWTNDFFAIWSFAKFATARPVPLIYDNEVLHDFQMDLGAYYEDHLPYAYPPFFLFCLMPLGFMSYYIAYAAWTVSTFLGYGIASHWRRLRLTSIFLSIFAPATIVNFTFGQTGFLSAALVVGGFRLAAKRPVLGGALFGLASIKPQLGVLIPIALVSARLWRTLASASVTICLLVLASGEAFGWSVWPLWLSKLLSHADWAAEVKDRYNPTITSSLTSLGVTLATVRIVQTCAAIVIIVITWMCFRRGVTLLATAALLVGNVSRHPLRVCL